MRKNHFTLFLLLFMTLTAQGQLTVYSDGLVGIANTTKFTYAKLAINNTSPSAYSSYRFNQFMRHTCTQSNIINVGLQSEVYPSTALNSGRAIGVVGIAGNTTSGWNYGVLGGLHGNQNGAGIFGTTSNVTGVVVNGRYAGYFDGNTYVSGTLTVPTVAIPSDVQQSEDVEALDEMRDGSTLRSLMNLNAITYSYKALTREERDTLTNAVASRIEEGHTLQTKHFGLLVEELQNVYPELVIEGQDGYLGINYVELIPLLVRSIQELKQELDEVKRNGDVASMLKSSQTGIEGSNQIETQAFLYQNKPNPFTSKTEIRFVLPDNTKEAFICVFDMTGKMKKQILVSKDMQSVVINGYELPSGIYLYSLVVNGQEMDTKRMILSD